MDDVKARIKQSFSWLPEPVKYQIKRQWWRLRGWTWPPPEAAPRAAVEYLSPAQRDRCRAAAVSVSIIIPTLNAGPDWPRHVHAWRAQTGFAAVELVVVDSGSTDGTAAAAAAAGARVLTLAPADFSHSGARNLGAAAAGGDYLFFTVQDALPPGPDWLQELFCLMQVNGVSAASPTELPRRDADLFYRVSDWLHREFMGVNDGSRRLRRPVGDDYVSRRRNAQISDVACLIERAVFQRYQYRGDFAEDLDLGLRLTAAGHRLGLFRSLKIIHSHNRPAGYHLRRGFVDERRLCQIFPEYELVARRPAVELLAEILLVHELLQAFVTHDLPLLPRPCPVPRLGYAVQRRLGAFTPAPPAAAVPDFAGGAGFIWEPAGDPDDDAPLTLAAFLAQVEAVLFPARAPRPAPAVLLPALRHFLGTAQTYLLAVYDALDGDLLADYEAMLFKTFAFQTGVHLGAVYSRGDDADRALLAPLYASLTRGV